MAYTKIVFQNSPSTATPLNAENLNHMDDQIALNDQRLTEIETSYVKSFNGRKGEVTPQANDYNMSQITPTNGATVGQIPIVRNDGTAEEPNLTFHMEDVPSSGHTIVDQDGNELTQEPKMKFLDAFIGDNSTDEVTEIENIKEVDPADYASTTDEGIIVTDDGDDALIGAVSDDYVEVEQVTGGTKTYAQLLNELFTKIDFTKVSNISKIVRYASPFNYVYDVYVYNNSVVMASLSNADKNSPYLYSERIIAEDNNSTYVSANPNSASNKTDDTAPVGTKFILYYGNKKATVDLQTTANRCLLGDGRTVQGALNKSALSITPSSGITLDNGLFMMNGVVFGVLDISATNNFTQNSWNQIGQISNYSADSADMVMAWDSSNGAYFGTVMIETDGKIKVYPKITTKYCKVRF